MKYIAEAIPNEYQHVDYISKLIVAVTVMPKAITTVGLVRGTPAVGPTATTLIA
jgi:hypothetical protein